MNRTFKSCFALLTFCFLLNCLGCGASMDSAGSMQMKEDSQGFDSYSTAEFGAEKEMAFEQDRDPGSVTSGIETSVPNRIDENVIERKIIYTADFSLVVDDIEWFEREIKSRVQKLGGFLASGSLSGKEDRQRRGQWSLRVPVEQFEEMIVEITELGYPENASRDSRDVTEEFVDLDARIKSKKLLEERVLKLLERKEDKIQHVIEVERELARIRSDIERMEGRLRYLKDRVSMTTITVAAREEKDYSPPQTPILGERINSAWSLSWLNVQDSSADLLVWLVSIAPVTIIVVPLMVFAWLAIRFLWKSGRRQSDNPGQTV